MQGIFFIEKCSLELKKAYGRKIFTEAHNKAEGTSCAILSCLALLITL